MTYIEQIRSALSELKPELRKPWVILDRLPYIHATDDPNAKPYSTPVVGRFDYMESADYIMACNPSAMSNVLSYVDALKEERDKLLLIIKKVAAWNRSYPSSRVYGYGGIKKIAAEMDAIYVEACAAIAKAEGRTE